MELIRKWDASVTIIKGKRELGNLSNMFYVVQISGWEMFQIPWKKIETNMRGRRNRSNTKGKLLPQAKTPLS